MDKPPAYMSSPVIHACMNSMMQLLFAIAYRLFTRILYCINYIGLLQFACMGFHWTFLDLQHYRQAYNTCYVDR